MNIVIGRGNNRKVYELPSGELITAVAKGAPEEYKVFLNNICELLKIPC